MVEAVGAVVPGVWIPHIFLQQEIHGSGTWSFRQGTAQWTKGGLNHSSTRYASRQASREYTSSWPKCSDQRRHATIVHVPAWTNRFESKITKRGGCGLVSIPLTLRRIRQSRKSSAGTPRKGPGGLAAASIPCPGRLPVFPR